MDLPVATRALIHATGSRRRERWSRAQLAEHQRASFERLRRHVLARSPLYRELHRGLETAPLQALPILTKSMMVERFDELVTDRRISLTGVQHHMATAVRGERYLGRYRIVAGSGTTGEAVAILFDPMSFAGYLATFMRATVLNGGSLSPFQRIRHAQVGFTSAWKISPQVLSGLDGPWYRARRLLATDPIQKLIPALEEWQPHVIAPITSVGRQLAEEQIAGRLNISPRRVMLTGEVLTPETRRRIAEAWGGEPFDEYAATEVGVIAAECAEGRRKHLLEDLTIIEAVDGDNRPVPPGTWGSRVLVTPLWHTTQPLIRYALSDLVRLSPEPCPCGRTLSVLDAIQGREEERLDLPSATGTGRTAVDPILLHAALDTLPVSAWQIRIDNEAVVLVLARAPAGFDDARLVSTVTALLLGLGARPAAVHVRHVDVIPQTAAGKAPLIRPFPTPHEALPQVVSKP